MIWMRYDDSPAFSVALFRHGNHKCGNEAVILNRYIPYAVQLMQLMFYDAQAVSVCIFL